jgi:hypothetical protein
MAQFIRELKTQAMLKFNGRIQHWSTIYVEEYKTTWRVSAKHVGFEMCSAEGWRYKKSICKDFNSVINTFIHDFDKTRK